MNVLHMVGFSALLAMTVACASQAEPIGGTDGKQSSPVSGEPTDSPGPAPAPAPTPAPAPAPACTPLAKQTGGVNPASVYCAALGYAAAAESCAFPDGTRCEQWAFYRGECGQTHSFCNLHGGTVSNKIEDMGTWTASYALCTVPGGASCQEAAFAQSCSCE